MSFESYRMLYDGILGEIRASGMWKDEKVITTAQAPHLEARDDRVGPRRPLLNFCANNYLGLADHPDVVRAACAAMERHGYGMASVRFICGTEDIHLDLERALSDFLGTDSTILYSSCFDANGALFETLLSKDDVILTDELNHASIIDGVRLSRASRRIYRHSDMDDLRAGLVEHAAARVRLIVTDGVFSMQGDYARLDEICALAEEHRALMVVDDSHATGFIGARGRGTPERFGVADRVDLITSTLGKALGGGTGGFTSGSESLVTLLRQRSRPYLFSNSLAPATVGAALEVLALLEREPERIERLHENTRYFRRAMSDAGFRLAAGDHPIVPIMLGDERKTVEMARKLHERGIFVVGFTYPVVPKGQARIRVQVSAAHTRDDLDEAVRQFAAVETSA